MKNRLPFFLILWSFTPFICKASPITALIAARKQLADGEQKLAASIKDIRNVYIETEDEDIDEINKQIGPVNEQYQMVKKAYDDAKLVREIMPAAVPAMIATGFLIPAAGVVSSMIPVFGDVPELLENIRNLGGNVVDTLTQIKSTIEQTNAKLNPITDPQETFYKFTRAQLLMKKGNMALTMIINKIEKIIERAQAGSKAITNARPAGHKIILTK